MRQKSWNRPSPKSSPFSRLRMSFAALLTMLMVAGTVSVAGAELYRHQLYQGSIGGGQSTAALAVADQSGNNDNWSKYVEFEPDGSRHDSRFNFSTPDVADNQWLEIGINYRGPEYHENRWKLAVRNVRTNRWETVYTNRDVPNWSWTDTTIELDPPEDYRRNDGRVRLRWFSSNDNDVSQLDLLTVSVLTDTDPDPDPDPDPSGDWTLPPAGAGFDYQIGGDYSLPNGVSVVSRDWFEGSAASGAYNICYVNAFQTQPDESGVDRPDEKSNWPQNLLLNDLGDDPNWGGEYLVDLSSSSKRSQAASHIAGMVSTCATKGFDAVEFDNLDSWTRFDDTPLEGQVPFDKAEAVAYAELITDHAHGLGMAVAQKNTPQLGSNNSLNVVGFDFAIAEECGRYRECGDYSSVFGNQVIAIEYNSSGLSRACAAIGSVSSVVRRDVNVSRPGESGYRFQTC